MSGCRQGVPWVGEAGLEARAQFGRGGGRRASRTSICAGPKLQPQPHGQSVCAACAQVSTCFHNSPRGSSVPQLWGHATMTIWHSRARWPHMSPRLPTHWHPPLRKVQNDCRFATRRSANRSGSICAGSTSVRHSGHAGVLSTHSEMQAPQNTCLWRGGDRKIPRFSPTCGV